MQSLEKLEFIKRNKLDLGYLERASVWFDPIIDAIIGHHNSAQRPLILGINGCQGSGKTTLSDYLNTVFREKGLTCVSLSIDDFYLDHHQRQALAQQVHPLFATRGVPGTHDLELAFETLEALKTENNTVAIPRFDKASDNKFDRSTWENLSSPLDIIILEGWCVGIPAQEEKDLVDPINDLEAKYDPKASWRHFVNDKLATQYAQLWKQIDSLLMLRAPSFNCVFEWRLEQEEKLRAKNKVNGSTVDSKIMSADEIGRFIQHYERLTRHALKYLPEQCQHVFELDATRNIVAHHSPENTKTPFPQYTGGDL